jgi:hypothetical protein
MHSFLPKFIKCRQRYSRHAIKINLFGKAVWGTKLTTENKFAILPGRVVADKHSV